MNSAMGDRGETPPPGMWPWYNMYQQNSYQPGYPPYGHQGYYPYYGHGHPLPFNGQQPLLGMHPNAMKGFVSGGTLMPFTEGNNVNNSGGGQVAGNEGMNKKDESSRLKNEEQCDKKNTGKSDSGGDMPPLPPGPPPPPIMRFATPPPPPGTSPNNRFYQPNGVGPVKFSFGAKQQMRQGAMSGFGGNNNNHNNQNNQMNENIMANNKNKNSPNNNSNIFLGGGGPGGGGGGGAGGGGPGAGGGGKKKRKRNKGGGNNQKMAAINNAMNCFPPLPPHVLLKIPPPLPPGPPPPDNNPPLPPTPEETLPTSQMLGQNMTGGRNDRMEVDEDKSILHNSIGDKQINNYKSNTFSSRNQINSMRLDEVPQSLKNYMERCYGKCVTAMDHDRVDIILKGKIMRASADETLWTKDWDNEPLPLLANELENVTLKTSSPQHEISPQRKQSKGLSAAMESRLGGRRSFSHKSRSPIRNKSSPKRRRDRSDSSSSSEENYKSTKSSKSKMSKFNKSHSSSSKSKGKQNKVKSHFYSESGFIEEPVNPEVLEKRAARFSGNSNKIPVDHNNSSNSTFQEYHSPLVSMKRRKGLKLNFDLCNSSFQDTNGDIDFSDCHVIGTCQDIEKQYLRLTAAPEASAVRPPEILQLSLARIKERWVQNQDYFYACEQLKSVRQDLTVQGIRDALTVKVYETHARIALEKGDHAEFNQCQSQLHTLYSDVKSTNRQEFTAYRILYFIFTKEFMDITNVVGTLSDEDKKDECIDHALKVQSAWWLSNYHRLFKLYKSAPRMSSYLIDWFLPRERKLALKAIVKSYRPNLAVEFVSQELAFEQEDECLDFLTQSGVVYVDPERTKIDCKASVASVSCA